MQPNDDSMVVLGKIAGAFGVKGWVKIHAFTSEHEGIFAYKPWFLSENKQWRLVTLLAGQAQGKGLVAQLDGVDDRDKALALTGCEIGVLRSQLPVLPDGEYYWSDLTGLTVITLEGRELGKVDHFLETGANDVVVVKGDRERWLPWVMDQVIKSIDLKTQIIQVDWDPDF